MPTGICPVGGGVAGRGGGVGVKWWVVGGVFVGG